MAVPKDVAPTAMTVQIKPRIKAYSAADAPALHEMMARKVACIAFPRLTGRLLDELPSVADKKNGAGPPSGNPAPIQLTG